MSGPPQLWAISSGLKTVHVFVEEKFMHKLTHTVQTHIAQGSTAYLNNLVGSK